jgi:hypothetical protein
MGNMRDTQRIVVGNSERKRALGRPLWRWKGCIQIVLQTMLGRAMAQAVSRRPPTAEARLRSRVSPYGICGGQSGTGTGFSPSTSFFPCQFHSTGAPFLGKAQIVLQKYVKFIWIIVGVRQGLLWTWQRTIGCFKTPRIASVVGRLWVARTASREPWTTQKKSLQPTMIPKFF